MAKLQGKELRKFDQVNRMSLPPKYKKILGDEIVVFKPIRGESCIMLFSEESWENFYENILEGFEGADQAEAERRIADRSDSYSSGAWKRTGDGHSGPDKRTGNRTGNRTGRRIAKDRSYPW